MPPEAPLSSSAPSDEGRAAAHRLLAGGQSTSDPAGEVAAAERVCAEVQDGLSRWFGPYGSHALVSRALARAQTDHASLASVTISSTPPSRLVGIVQSGDPHGATATLEGIAAVLAALADLIAKLIGYDLANSLLDQCIAMSQNGQTAAPPSAGNDQSGHSSARARATGDVPQTVNET
jgi:hypothetical protein